VFPQTAVLKSALNLMNINIPVGQGINEFDPGVQIFSGGLDPYERRRAMRALAMMVDDGTVSEAMATDVAKSQTGPIWREAVIRAQDSRSWPQLSSFAFGVGFKPRSKTDMQIDIFDQEYRMLWAQARDMSPEQLRLKTDELREKYPFGDLVVIGRKGGLDRDRSYAYNVMSRIPPGQKDDLAELIKIDPKLFDKFYADKGRMDKWPESDYQKFMAGMVEIGAVLDLPDSATQAEWTLAKNSYTKLNDEMTAQYGADINERISVFYAKRKDNADAAYEWLEGYPDLQEAMDYKEQRLIYDPSLAPYYASIDKIENYYRSRMYDAIEDVMGKGVWDLLDKWGTIRDRDQKAANAFWKKSGLEEYSRLKEVYSKQAAEATAKVGNMLRPFRLPNLRDDYSENELGIGAQDLLQSLGSPAPTPYQYTWGDWAAIIPSTSLRNLLVDSFHGDELEYRIQERVDQMAEDVGIDPGVMIELMQESYFSQ